MGVAFLILALSGNLTLSPIPRGITPSIIPCPINEQITGILTTAQTSTHTMSSTQPSNIHAGMSSPPRDSSGRRAPDPSGYDPAVYEILYGPTLAKGVECPAYDQPLNLPVPEDELEDELSRLDSVTGSGQGGQQQQK